MFEGKIKVMKCGIAQIISALTVLLSQTQLTESLFVGRFPRRFDSDTTVNMEYSISMNIFMYIEKKYWIEIKVSFVAMAQSVMCMPCV